MTPPIELVVRVTNSGSDRPHVARVPFKVVGDTIGLDDGQRHEFLLDGFPAVLERRLDWHALTVTTPSFEAAEAALPQLVGALKVMAVRWRLALRMSAGRAHITRPRDSALAVASIGLPRAANGLGDGHLPAVYAAEEEPVWMLVNDANLSVNHTPSTLVPSLRLSNALNDEKLTVAIDFFISHLTLGTREARLIALVIALESLRQNQPNHPAALALIERWVAEARRAATSLENDEARDSVQQLAQALGYHKQISLSKQLQRLVREAYASLGADAARAAVDAVKECYTVRSRLAHDGMASDADIIRATALLTSIVPAVLLYRANGEVPPPLR